jgi:Ca2+/Na+ antiporter
MDEQFLSIPSVSRADFLHRKMLKLELKNAKRKHLIYLSLIDISLVLFLIILLLIAIISKHQIGYWMAFLGLTLYMGISYFCHRDSALLNEKIETAKNYNKAANFILVHLCIAFFFTLIAISVIFLSNLMR